MFRSASNNNPVKPADRLGVNQTVSLEEYKALAAQGKEPHTSWGNYFDSVHTTREKRDDVSVGQRRREVEANRILGVRDVGPA